VERQVELARFVPLLATMFLQLARASLSLLLLSSTDLEDGMILESVSLTVSGGQASLASDRWILCFSFNNTAHPMLQSILKTAY
jgi:hypothetical protein